MLRGGYHAPGPSQCPVLAASGNIPLARLGGVMEDSEAKLHTVASAEAPRKHTRLFSETLHTPKV